MGLTNVRIRLSHIQKIQMEYDCHIFSKYPVFQTKNLVFQSKYLVFQPKTLE